MKRNDSNLNISEGYINQKERMNPFMVNVQFKDSLTEHLFKIDLRRTYFPLSMYVSFSPGFIDNGTELLNQEQRVFSFNPYIYLEPQWSFEKWSFGLPVILGLKYNKNTVNTEIDLGSYYYTVSSEYLNDQPITVFPIYRDEYYSYKLVNIPFLDYSQYSQKIHRPEVLWQFGLSGKYYPFGINLFSFYIGQELSIGRGNYNRANHYLDLDTVHQINQWHWPVDTSYLWKTSSEKVFYCPSKFNYLRYQTRFGIDLNFTRFISLNVESSFSTRMKNKGENDSVFVSKFGGPYEFYLSEQYQFINPDKGNFIRFMQVNTIFNLKISLLIKLGTKRKED
ncbi:MAG: hypothetical protein IPM77_14355 [Crocinitomicaceae bacterium]|nr:hypothetical protein [Crocinitomicaceae bacterium]